MISERRWHDPSRTQLVNAIIHADYAARTALLVLKGPDYFEFRNPGRMRVTINDALAGGNSDCRNRNMQKMFAMIGLGERAGSGIPRVLAHWKSQHYRPPELMEDLEREYTTMRLRTVSLFPEEVLEDLGRRFGRKFKQMESDSRLALATAHIEGFVTNARVRQITRLHSQDITAMLRDLVNGGMLEADGKGRWTTYRVAGAAALDLAQDYAPESIRSAHLPERSEHLPGGRSEHLPDCSEHLSGRSEHLPDRSEHLEIETGDSSLDSDLLKIAAPVREAPKIKKETVRNTILELCRGRFLTIQQLAQLLDRSYDGLRQRFVKPMISEGLLERRFPQQPNHDRQAYRTREPTNG